MKEFFIIFLISLPIGFYLTWYLEGNHGKTTYGNFFNWLLRREV